MSDEPHPTGTDEPVVLLWLDDDPAYQTFVADALEAVTTVDVAAESDPETAIDRAGDVDCLVSAYDFPTTDGLDVLGAVREHHPQLPFLLHTTTPLEKVGDGLFDADEADYVRKDWDELTVRLVARRARMTVERDRYRSAARRLFVAVDSCRDPMLVADSDDAIEYANGQFASAVSPARTDLCGRKWTDLFTDESVQQLQHEAVPVGTEGWTWSGRAVLSAAGGDCVPAHTTLVQLEDGSKVFAFRDLNRST